MKHIAYLILLLTAASAAMAQNRGFKPIVNTTNNGSINWSGQYLEAKGVSFINTKKFKNTEQAIEMAKTGAETVARRNLLLLCNDLVLTSVSVVNKQTMEKDHITQELNGTIKGAYRVGEFIIDENKVQVTMRLNIYKNNSFVDPPAKVIKEKVLVENNENNNLSENQKKMRKKLNQLSAEMPIIALDLNGQKFDEQLFPRFIGTNGGLIIDFEDLYAPPNSTFAQYLAISKADLKMPAYAKSVSYIKATQNSKLNIVVDTDKYPTILNFAAWIEQAATGGNVTIYVVQ